MTFFDVVFLAILVVSAFAGFVRGGAKEIVTLFAFLLAAVGSLLLLPVTGPMFRRMIDPDIVGTAAAVIVIFLVLYAIVRLTGAYLGQRLQKTEHLGGVDRAVGLGFGVIRALVLVGVFHLVFHAATPPERIPTWLRNAALYPVSALSAKAIQLVLPKIARGADAVAPAVERNAREGATDQPQSSATDRRAPEKESQR